VEHFDFYLKPRCEWKLPKPPRVMVEESDWVDVCKGLVASRVCTFIEEAEVFHTDQGPLLNGLFGVSKEEWTEDGTEIFRLIMNLVPLNSLCRPMSGDVDIAGLEWHVTLFYSADPVFACQLGRCQMLLLHARCTTLLG
jgi:hypothetical protein